MALVSRLKLKGDCLSVILTKLNWPINHFLLPLSVKNANGMKYILILVIEYICFNSHMVFVP
ncbi:unnamed protein product [Prunus brigantina]